MTPAAGRSGVECVVRSSVPSGKSGSDCRDVPTDALLDECLCEGCVLELTGALLHSGKTELERRGRQITLPLALARGYQLNLLSLFEGVAS